MTGTVQPIASIDLALARGIGQMVDAADNVGDAHVVIVDHHRQIVGRRAVGAQDDQIVEVLVLEHDASLHRSSITVSPSLRRLEADRRRDIVRRLARGDGRASARHSAAAVRRPRPAPASPRAPPASNSSDRPGRAASSSSAISRWRAARANCDSGSPSQSRPSHVEPVENGVDRRVGRALAVGILDAQQHLAAMAPGIEPS